MKKLISLALISALGLGIASCSSNTETTETAETPEATTSEVAADEETVAAEPIDGAEFLKKKAEEEGYVKTASGLVYKMIKPGNGENFKETDVVLTKYVGKHVDGTEFDNSKGNAVPFPCTGVIKGFAEMLQLMKPGAKAEVIIPGELGYGEKGVSDPMGMQVIGPNEVLVFELETVGKQ